MKWPRASTDLRYIHRVIGQFGIDLRRLAGAAPGLLWIWRDLRKFRHLRDRAEAAAFPLGRFYPVYSDRSDSAGEASGHYFHQDLYVARRVFQRQPRRHLDVGSSTYGFVSHVASFREIDVLDIRPLKSVKGINFIQQDLMSLPSELHQYADSVSCLHVLEHFGLGRYGDPLDPHGWAKGLQALKDLLQDGGTLYLSVPSGEKQRIEFNAHRVFGIPFLRNHLQNFFRIDEFAFVDDEGHLHEDVSPWSAEADASFGAHFGLSIWTLRKTSSGPGNAWSKDRRQESVGPDE